jgi:Tfp pilus assembly protein PilF
MNSIRLNRIRGASVRLAYLAVTATILTSCASMFYNTAKKQDEIIDTQLSIAGAQLDGGDAARALQTVKPLLSTFPNNYKVLTMGGMSHLALANPTQALLLLRRAYDIEPTTATGLNLSSALIAAGEQTRARNVLRKLVKGDENYGHRERLYHNLGLSYQKERNYPAAKKYFYLALNDSPSFYMSLIALAKIAKELNDAKGAKGFLKKAVKSCPSCYEPVHLLATYYINDGELKLAHSLLQSYAARDDAQDEDRESSRQLMRHVQSMEPQLAKTTTPDAKGQPAQPGNEKSGDDANTKVSRAAF